MARVQLSDVFPVLPARNVRDAIRFYVDRLGFEVRFQDDPDQPEYAGVQRDNIVLHLQFQFDRDFQAGSAGRCFVRILVDDPDALFAEYSDKGVFQEWSKCGDTDWGTREFALADPDGNVLTFMRDL